MEQVINHLIQLQELNFALAEQTAANPNAELQQLTEAIKSLVGKLPEDISRRYLALQRRSSLAVVPVVRNGCSGCGLSLPAATINDLKAGRRLHSCPHCGRFVYVLDGAVRVPAATVKVKSPPRAGIARFSSETLMLPRLQAKTRDDAIHELAQVMAADNFIDDGTGLAKLALDREAMISTAVEHGLAFPQGRNVESGSLTLALGLRPAGIKFGAPDNGLTRIIFFLVIPTASSAFYLKLLTGLVRTFSDAKARESLLECDQPKDMWKTLTALTRTTIP